jgi:hypothetical protein
MGFMDKLKGLVSAPGEEPNVIWLHVRCNRCGEGIRSRINLEYDLTPVYAEEGAEEGYAVRKVLIGSGHCFQPVEVTLHFDPQRRITAQEINGGEFITTEEYACLTGGGAASPE